MSWAAKHNDVNKNKKDIFLNNLIGGIAWGIGLTVGASLVLTIAGIIITKVNTVPLVGDYVESVTKYVAAKQQTAIDTVDKRGDK